MKNKTKQRLEKKNSFRRFVIGNYIFKDHCYNCGLDEICKRINRYRGVINQTLNWYRFTQKEFDKKCVKKGYSHCAPYPAGYLPEAYIPDDLEKIEDNLFYISDRFYCDFRLEFLLAVPDVVSRLKK